MFHRECDTEVYHLVKSGKIADSLVPSLPSDVKQGSIAVNKFNFFAVGKDFET